MLNRRNQICHWDFTRSIKVRKRLGVGVEDGRVDEELVVVVSEGERGLAGLISASSS